MLYLGLLTPFLACLLPGLFHSFYDITKRKSNPKCFFFNYSGDKQFQILIVLFLQERRQGCLSLCIKFEWPNSNTSV